MGLRGRVWPGLSAGGVALELVVAALGLVGACLGDEGLGGQVLWVRVRVVLVVLAVTALLLLRRRAPLVPLLVAAVPAATTAFLAALPVLALASYAVGRFTGAWRVRVASAVVGTAAVLSGAALTWDPAWSVGLASVAAVVALPAALGAWQRTREQLVLALRDRAEQAESERELLARDAVLVERTRIAREMHDAVGHQVSLMVLQAGAIEVAAGQTERVEQLAGHVQDAGRRALVELRDMVGVLRDEGPDDGAPVTPQPGLDALPRLIDQAQEAGLRVEFSSSGALTVDPPVGRAAYRIAQEALTNAGKHAPGAAVLVSVDRGPGELVVRVVSDAPTRPVPPFPTGGHGLVGLGERVRTLHGRFTAGPRPDGGFTVEAVLPT